jgi:NitT/TauT family transport system ATP-binding protein
LILDILQNHFSPNEAQRQLDTAIDWGRYSELYSYDDPSGEIFLEETYSAQSFN